jgi:cell division septum initiation protein DivIVA
MPKLNLFLLLDHLEKLTDNNFSIAGKVLIDKDELEELITKMRSAIPEEIKEAEWVSREKEKYLVQAQEEAKRLLREAETYVEKLVREDQITTRAEEEAKRIISEANQSANHIEADAMQYANSILEQLEENLERTIRIVRKGREEMVHK